MKASQKLLQRKGKALGLAIAGLLAILGFWGSPAWALSDDLRYNAPELLPDKMTNVVDLGKLLNEAQEQQLTQSLQALESRTGWKLRVLTQVDVTPGRAVKEFWGLNDRSVLLVADTRGRNLLNFSVGDDVYKLLPRTFWIELQSRYGNQFFVREEGYDRSILAAVEAIAGCLEREGCAVVPGLPQEQWVLTLMTSVVGGAIFGFAGHPRHEGQVFAWKWALVFAPLWGMLFLVFGIGPVVSRTTEWLPLLRNAAGFIGGATIAYLVPPPQRSPQM
ncbi:MAG TPA: methanol dehydrogenase [Cyanobacteria bacterium UBA8156]|jgi:hypothetical protein|nr:methanol dehydrogenase [Cyanobacteria bacterium UBA8156]